MGFQWVSHRCDGVSMELNAAVRLRWSLCRHSIAMGSLWSLCRRFLVAMEFAMEIRGLLLILFFVRKVMRCSLRWTRPVWRNSIARDGTSQLHRDGPFSTPSRADLVWAMLVARSREAARNICTDSIADRGGRRREHSMYRHTHTYAGARAIPMHHIWI